MTLSQEASAGAVFLLGTDVIEFHADSNFINPVMNQLVTSSGTGGNKILMLTSGANSVNYTGSSVTFDFKSYSFFTGASAATLAGYAAIYIDSPGTCCSDAGIGSFAAGDAAKFAAYRAAGGSIGVGNYQGAPIWESMLGFTGTAASVLRGAISADCLDPGVSTPGGLAFGFAPSYTEGCFVHQTYNPTFWTSHGFFALQTYTPTGGAAEWVTIAAGFVDPGGPAAVPEPESIALIAIGLLGIVGIRRRRA